MRSAHKSDMTAKSLVELGQLFYWIIQSLFPAVYCDSIRLLCIR